MPFSRSEIRPLNVFYINFDNNEIMKKVFDIDFDISRIISAVKIEYGRSFNPEDTLIIFDEIQEAPKALASLKYFYENAPQYAIMAAGSLLGVAMHQGTSFPVGKVDFMHLYPLDFFEFVYALGEKELARLLESGNFEMINAYSTRYTELLKMYYYIGGMPEVVQTFLDTDDFYEVREVQKNLLEYYEEDFSKHAPREVIPRIMMVWNSIPLSWRKKTGNFYIASYGKGRGRRILNSQFNGWRMQD